MPVQNLDDTDLGSPRQWTFLAARRRGVDIVSLPEPIHMTHEFPLVRAGIVECLNEHMGFRVLAMECSAVDAWATQDRFLASDKTEQDAADAQLAVLARWAWLCGAADGSAPLAKRYNCALQSEAGPLVKVPATRSRLN
jgi:erythromycin esterase-like protein